MDVLQDTYTAREEDNRFGQAPINMTNANSNTIGAAQSGANGWSPHPQPTLHDVLTTAAAQPALGLSWSEGDLYNTYVHDSTPHDPFQSFSYSYTMGASPADADTGTDTEHHHQDFVPCTRPLAPFALPNGWPNQADNIMIPNPFDIPTAAHQHQHPPHGGDHDGLNLADFFDPLSHLQQHSEPPSLPKDFSTSTSEPSWQVHLPSLTDSAAASPAVGTQDSGEGRIVELEELTAPSLHLSQQHQHAFPATGTTLPVPRAAGALTTEGASSSSISDPVGWTSKAASPSATTAQHSSTGDLSSVPPEQRKRRPTRHMRPKAKECRTAAVQELEPGGAADLGPGLSGLLEESEADDDSDVYQPSRSSSYSAAASPASSASFDSSAKAKMKTQRGRGRPKRSLALKGSAALALMTSKRRGNLEGGVDGEGEGEEGGSICESVGSSQKPRRKRKNSVIPLPVPVPGLAKKSRGRKVPYVAPLGVEGGDESKYVAASAGLVLPTRGKSKRKRAESGEAVGGGRSFVCAECGKCFVRGEHLKRHVRSIHTHDKPHPCPFEGCDKSFSRRDNLGQHVRVHLP